MRGFIASLLRLALLGVTALTVLPLLWRISPRLIAFEAMAPQLAAAGALLIVLNLLMKSRAAALIGAITLAWNGMLLWPELAPKEPVQTAAGAPTLKLLSFNVFYANADAVAVRELIAGSGADIVGLIEVMPEMKAALAPLRAAYPYGIDCIDLDPNCATMLLSKHPLREAFAGRIDGRYPYVAEAELDWNGIPLGIAVTHLSWPFMEPGDPGLDAVTLPQAVAEFPDVPRLSQSVQAASLALHMTRRSGDFVLMGDFNSPPWSPLQGAFRAATGLDNRGHLLLTWPTKLWPVARIPIDSVFVRGRASILGMATGPEAGSDHLPVLAEIALRR
jgi:endonuclease/exonuclease/phosphatase (EEP) superfamily protein YafD